MQNLEYQKNIVFSLIDSIKEEQLMISLEKFVRELLEYSNPDLKYVKPIKERFDVDAFVREQGFSMRNIRNMRGALADEDSFDDLLNDLSK